MDMCIRIIITLLYSRNYHNISNQPYFNKTFKMKKKRQKQLMPKCPSFQYYPSLILSWITIKVVWADLPKRASGQCSPSYLDNPVLSLSLQHLSNHIIIFWFYVWLSASLKYIYSLPLNNTGLNCMGPLICGFFFSINTCYSTAGS